VTSEKLTPEQQHNALSTLATVIGGLADGVRDAKVILGQFDESLLDVDAVRTDHIGLSLDWALSNLRSALFTVDSLAVRVRGTSLLPAPLRTFVRSGDEPPAEVTALSFASNGKTEFLVRNPVGGWDMAARPDATLPPSPGATWKVITKHVNVAMTEVRQ
jgi:hypothetical protein